MPKKLRVVIFLDIDGVLLDPKIKALHQKQGKKLDFFLKLFDKDAISYLHQLINKIETNGFTPFIVLSSSWRERLSIAALQQLFVNFLFSRYLLSKTADLVCDSFTPGNALCRAEEIELWLQENKADIASFVILDDYDQGMSQLFMENFVQCRSGVFGLNEFNRASLILSTPLAEQYSTLPINSLALDIYSNSKLVEKESEKLIRVTNATRKNYLYSLFRTSDLDKRLIDIITDYELSEAKCYLG